MGKVISLHLNSFFLRIHFNHRIDYLQIDGYAGNSLQFTESFNGTENVESQDIFTKANKLHLSYYSSLTRPKNTINIQIATGE